MKDKILLGHGSGGNMTAKLINKLFLKNFNNPTLNKLTDAAVLEIADKRVAFTTDSFVVKPVFFPGGDIGKLSVCGSINDLVMMGAVPKYLSLAMIIEEGFDYKKLEIITESIMKAAKESNVEVVTGDTKVVEKGSCDGIFINTSAIGEVIKNAQLSKNRIKPGDKIIITGYIAQHGIAVLSARQDLDFKNQIKSDCASLNHLLIPLIKEFNSIKFMRDPTRGGVATVLNEIVKDSDFGITIYENKIPVDKKTKSACDILGFDPLYIANEGKAVIIVAKEDAGAVLKKLRRDPLGKNSSIVGEIVSGPKQKVYLNTTISGSRIVDMPESDPVPRIC